MALVIGRTSSHCPLSMFYASVLNPLDYQLLVLMICNDLESFCWFHHLLPALIHFHGNWYAYLYVLFCFRWAVCRVVESSGWNMWVGFNWAVHLEHWRTVGFTVYSNLYTDVRRVAARHNSFCVCCMILLQHVSARIKGPIIGRTGCQRKNVMYFTAILTSVYLYHKGSFGVTNENTHMCLWGEECRGHWRVHKPFCGHACNVRSENVLLSFMYLNNFILFVFDE